MPDRLSKQELYEKVTQSVKDAAWGVLFLPDAGEPALRVQINRGTESYRIKIYIWNLTHGGGARRPKDEFRIQVTGLHQFDAEVNGQTLILGWWSEASVFAAFDYNKYSAPLGASPSLQIGEQALRKAAVNGLAPYNKGNDEIAIAIRPDYLVEYIQNRDQLHAFGETPQSIEILDNLMTDPQEITDDIIDQFDVPRRTVLRTVRMRVRNARFRTRVLEAYGNACAICGMQLELIEAAHIIPVVYPESSDRTSNGLALCVLHHEAYDSALIGVNSVFQVMINQAEPERFRRESRSGGRELFISMLRHSPIHVPKEPMNQPDIGMIARANQLRGWESLASDQVLIVGAQPTS